MKAYKLKKEYLKEYLKSLESFGEVWGPVKKVKLMSTKGLPIFLS